MKYWVFTALSIVLICVAFALSTSTAIAQNDVMQKIHPWVVEHTQNGQQAEFMVMMKERPDLSPAFLFKDKVDRTRFVYETLLSAANRSQAPLRKWLEERGITYRWYYTTNALLVKGDLSLVTQIAQRDDVEHIYGNPVIKHKLPIPEFDPMASVDPLAIEWNVTKIKAPQVWTTGHRGEGVVVGGQDTGYRWTHLAIKNQYRGWNGTTADHNYNWHDSVHTTGSICGADSPVPCDDDGHGTHTMGTVMGSDFAPPTTTCVSTTTNQVGVAPCARWIGCRDMNAGAGTPTLYIECFDWFLAPYPVGGTPSQGDPTKAPDLTTNSWGCPSSEGCSWNQLQPSVDAHYAAGIMFVAAAGNSGSSCNTITDAPAMYQHTFTVGSTTSSDAMSSFSSRGPGTGSGLMKPNIVTPGSNVRSCLGTSDTAYTSMDGTSMATPCTAGGIALLWSCLPSIINNIDQTITILNATDVRLTAVVESCGGDYVNGPNNTWGYGLMDVQAACNYCTPPAAPTGLAATTPVNNTIHLSWNTSTGATSYKVYRAVATGCPGSGFTLKGTVTAPTLTYDDTSVSGGVTYAYVVRASNVCDSTDSNCAQATATGACTMAPTFAGITSATDNGTASCGIMVAWPTAASNCPVYPTVRYTVYRDTTSGFPPGPANQIATCLTGTTYNDVTVNYGTTYYYVVRAEDSGTGGSGPCNNGNLNTSTAQASASPSGGTTVLFTDGFESGVGNWTISTRWQAAVTYAHTGTYSLISTDPTSLACATCRKTTASAIPASASTPLFHFWTRYNMESGYDAGIVHGSSNGTTWVKLTVAPTYPGNTTTSAQACLGTNPQPAFTGASATWTEYTVDLNSYKGGSFYPRFTYATDASVSNGGWYIDDVKIDYKSTCTTGSSSAGLVKNYLTMSKSGTNLSLSWQVPGGTCQVTGYGVYRGILPWTAYNYASLTCAATGTTYSTPQDTGSYYFVVVPNNSTTEGSYGKASSGTERPVAATPCRTQNLTICNP